MALTHYYVTPQQLKSNPETHAEWNRLTEGITSPISPWVSFAISRDRYLVIKIYTDGFASVRVKHCLENNWTELHSPDELKSILLKHLLSNKIEQSNLID